MPASSTSGASADFALNHVSLGYGPTHIVRDIHGAFATGSTTAIIGPNGAGKSTLLKGLVGLLQPQRGTIASRHPKHMLGYLPQASEVEPQFPITVEDFVAVGLWSRMGSLRGVPPSLMQRVAEAISAVGLQGQATDWVGELSGGQFQRMRFARLWVQDPPVVLLDEPFAGVDEPTTAVLLELMHAWRLQGKTVIAVLHDREIVKAHFPYTLALARQGVAAWGDTPSVLTGWTQAGACA